MKEAIKYDTVYSSLMADHHIGYSISVGVIIAYQGKICVNWMGFDISCDNKAVLVDCPADEVKSNIYRTMNEVQKHISFGIGRKNNEKGEHDQQLDSNSPMFFIRHKLDEYGR